jgi:nitrite reductase (NADH) small subunit
MSATATSPVFNIGPLSRIPPGEGRCFRVAGEEIAVFHTRDGTTYATQARCPHRGGPLADGLVGDGRVICPLHSRVFLLDTGEAERGRCPALRTYPTRLNEAGEILVDLGGGEEERG